MRHCAQGGVSSPHTLSLVGEDYIISAQPDKPLLNVWQVRRISEITVAILLR